MNADQRLWQAWANFLQQWGLNGWVATILEDGSPFSLLGAQLIYLSQPLLESFVPKDHLNAIARMLEDTNSKRAFADYIRKAPGS